MVIYEGHPTFRRGRSSTPHRERLGHAPKIGEKLGTGGEEGSLEAGWPTTLLMASTGGELRPQRAGIAADDDLTHGWTRPAAKAPANYKVREPF